MAYLQTWIGLVAWRMGGGFERTAHAQVLCQPTGASTIVGCGAGCSIFTVVTRPFSSV